MSDRDLKPDNTIRATARNGDVHLRFPGRIYVMSPSEARTLILALAVAATQADAQSQQSSAERDPCDR
jgi:hypothetical protein